eukprot:1208401-Amphidinium_carterae.1
MPCFIVSWAFRTGRFRHLSRVAKTSMSPQEHPGLGTYLGVGDILLSAPTLEGHPDLGNLPRKRCFGDLWRGLQACST